MSEMTAFSNSDHAGTIVISSIEGGWKAITLVVADKTFDLTMSSEQIAEIIPTKRGSAYGVIQAAFIHKTFAALLDSVYSRSFIYPFGVEIGDRFDHNYNSAEAINIRVEDGVYPVTVPFNYLEVLESNVPTLHNDIWNKLYNVGSSADIYGYTIVNWYGPRGFTIRLRGQDLFTGPREDICNKLVEFITTQDSHTYKVEESEELNMIKITNEVTGYTSHISLEEAQAIKEYIDNK